MGTYLSTPVTEKGVECGESAREKPQQVTWGVVDMQGWRKNMEDAHVAHTNVTLSDDVTAKVFGVFDGHGGPEVARFCALYLVSVLQQQPTWKAQEDVVTENVKQSNIGASLVGAFHALDRMIDDPTRREEINQLRAMNPDMGVFREATSIPPLVDTPTAPQVVAGEFLSLADRPDNIDEVSNSVSSSDSEDSRKANGTLTMNDNNKQSEKATESNDDDDDNSQEAVGKEEAAELDQNIDETDIQDEDEQEAKADATGRVTAMFQRLLALSGQAAGQGVLMLGGTEASSPPGGSTASKAANEPFRASIEQNGRMICNLPEHAIHAGATAIVAVLTDDGILTIANAGDSRAVLCRAHGEVYALSEDHKPMQQGELSRISKAGGFVNTFGRVNGNLNLSRSIGDLKYKQVPGISPAEQMITAEPDIVQVRIDPTDEFIILGCDGIWDCLTNEKAVAYVRSRIDIQPVTSIGREMLDEIISVDPRVTQGIGGDNMTIMVIDLQPEKRTYHEDASVPSALQTEDDVMSPVAKPVIDVD